MFYKYQDFQCVENCDSEDPSQRVHYEQPGKHQRVNSLLLFFLTRLAQYGNRLICENAPSIAARAAEHACRTRFLGEMLCFIPVLIARFVLKKRAETQQPKTDGRIEMTGKRVLWLWLPALCDLTGTTVRTVTRTLASRPFNANTSLQLMNGTHALVMFHAQRCSDMIQLVCCTPRFLSTR